MPDLIEHLLSFVPLPVEAVAPLHQAQGLEALVVRLEEELPPLAASERNQAFVTLKTLTLLHKGEYAAANELLQCAATFHSQDTVLQGLKFSVEQRLRPEELRRKHDLSSKLCPLPFTRLDIGLGFTEAHLCCASYLPRSIGNLTEYQGMQVWQSPQARAIRASILDGSYAYCNKITCPAIGACNLPTKQADTVHALMESVRLGPTRLNLSFDKSCNLSCPSCRTERVHESAALQRDYIRLFDSRVRPLLNNLECIEICGSGDPFASRSMRYALETVAKEYPGISTIHLMTNAQLFQPEYWESLPGLDGRVQFYVSVDAATPETYATVRRGGTFEKLLPKLRYFGELQRQGRVKRFMMAFVVQQRNYKEMPAFIQLAKDVGATMVSFARMTNWGTMSPQAYAGQCIWNTSHKEHAQFLEVMADPIFYDPIVAQSDLWAFRAPQR